MQVICPDRLCSLPGRKRFERGLAIVHVQLIVEPSFVVVSNVLGQALAVAYLLLNAPVEPFKIAVGLKGDTVLN